MKLVDDDGNEVAPGEIGEILIKGHNVMKGYWQRPEATAESIKDGWFATGDMAKVDEDGYFFIVDRKKDLIIRGGYNVYPREVEEVLYEHPAVREAAVVGVPHDELGEEVGAAVALKDGESVDAEELQAFVKEQVAAYKYPRKIWFVDELPKGPTGKILKREISRRRTWMPGGARGALRPDHRRHGLGGHGRGRVRAEARRSRSRASSATASAATACGPAACRPRRCSPRRRRRTRCATPTPTA